MESLKKYLGSFIGFIRMMIRKSKLLFTMDSQVLYEWLWTDFFGKIFAQGFIRMIST
jgi:hypothetical protein